MPPNGSFVPPPPNTRGEVPNRNGNLTARNDPQRHRTASVTSLQNICSEVAPKGFRAGSLAYRTVVTAPGHDLPHQGAWAAWQPNGRRSLNSSRYARAPRRLLRHDLPNVAHVGLATNAYKSTGLCPHQRPSSLSHSSGGPFGSGPNRITPPHLAPSMGIDVAMARGRSSYQNMGSRATRSRQSLGASRRRSPPGDVAVATAGANHDAPAPTTAAPATALEVAELRGQKQQLTGVCIALQAQLAGAAAPAVSLPRERQAESSHRRSRVPLAPQEQQVESPRRSHRAPSEERAQAQALLSRTLPPACLRRISASPFVSQQTQLEDTPASPTPLPPRPSSGSPLYQENWRNPTAAGDFLVPARLAASAGSYRIQAFSQTLDAESLANVFADWTATQRWGDMKQLFEFWIRTLGADGKPNRPDVDLFNHYLRANFMLDASAGELLDLVAQMEEYEISPNTASYNLVLKAMFKAKESEAAQKLLDRMLQTGQNSFPNDESYNLVIGLLFSVDEIDSALKYIDLLLKNGYMLSMNEFTTCVKSCISAGRLDTLTSIIEKCKTMDQNKALCPPWNLSNFIANIAFQSDNNKLGYLALEFLARWIARGEIANPPVFLSADEGLVVSALGTVARTFDSTLLDASWSVLKRSLRQKRPPAPESYFAKIYAHASLGNLQRAFSTLNEFETSYRDSPEAEDLFSPFTSLRPLVVACSKNGFGNLDMVYVQLETLASADPPYKSVAALNCIILGCANIWDLDRAYQTFEAITSPFELIPDIHSYNALMCAFGKLNKTFEASRVFEHLTGLGLKPNSTTYSLLVDAHLANKDQKAALSVIQEMVNAGFTPSKETLKKVRRRCVRELDFDSNDEVESLARNSTLVLRIWLSLSRTIGVVMLDNWLTHDCSIKILSVYSQIA
ncbi:hypothetical protein Taro_007910 [Colocasia esculenta]|uniref:Pentatricopeptide repeat-containing protein n=1 Tax=Colocasia esculenta TaxID=4460 RepID=A0A843TWW0_COLES|nr:hypothetical protein [Colocasia esculenta]